MARATTGPFRAAGALAALLVCPACARTAAARELWASGDGESSVELQTALKASTLAPEASAATGLWRLRFGLDARLGPAVGFEAAYEQRTRTTPGGASGSLAVLPPDVDAPYRIAQLDEVLIEEGTDYSYRHELDRAMASLHLDRAEITLGRQAVGWGRGVLFGAVDVFSPFTPFEVDREWRRGIDAIRTDLRLSDRYSLDVVAAFDGPGPDDWESSALLGRFRGSTPEGFFDSELIFGKRAGDTMYAGTFSASVGDAAVHGELAFFDTPERFHEGGLFGHDFYVAKAVLGASYTFDVGSGLTVWAEYHFSGFGSENVTEAVARLLSDPTYQARFFRGDMQMLGRHAAAVQAACSLTDAWALNLVWIGSGTDGSGVVAPAFTWSFSDNVTIATSGYVPYGPQVSEYGSGPFTAFLQVRIYD
jgi:hypothetical protein